MHPRTLGALALLAAMAGCADAPWPPPDLAPGDQAGAPPSFHVESLTYARTVYLAANPGAFTRDDQEIPPAPLREGDRNLVIVMTWTPVAPTARELALFVYLGDETKDQARGPSPLEHRAPSPEPGDWRADVGVPFGTAFANQAVRFDVRWERPGP